MRENTVILSVALPESLYDELISLCHYDLDLLEILIVKKLKGEIV